MLRDRRLLAVLGAEIVSGLGSYMSFLAIPWFVLVTTGSAARMGVVLAAEIVPIALLGIPSGTLVGRIGARTTMWACDLARAPVVAAIPLLHAGDLLSFPLLVGLVALIGAFSGPHFAAQRLILPELVGEDERVVAKANSVVEGAQRINQLAGPLLAGVLIAAMGASNVLYVDAATFLVSSLLIAAVMPRRQPRVAGEADEDGGGLLAGLRFLVRDPLLGPIMIVTVVSNALGQALLAALPVLAYEEFDRSSRVAGVFYAAMGLGAVVGTVIAFKVVERFPPLPLAAVAALASVLPRWLLGIDLPVVGVVAVLAASALWNPIGNAPMLAIFTVRTPPALRAKVMTALITFATLAMPAGLLVVGPLLEAWGPRPVFLVLAAGMTASSLFFAWVVLRARETRDVAAVAA
jgi:MFS family permease